MTNDEYRLKIAKAHGLTVLMGMSLIMLMLYIFQGYVILLTISMIATIWLSIKVYILYIHQVGMQYIDEQKKPFDKEE